jgi:hypothetical protein
LSWKVNECKPLPAGLRVARVYDTAGVLAAPDSPLGAPAVDLRPGDVITRVDGVRLNASAGLGPVSVSLPRALLGKAGMQVLLEVELTPRDPPDEDDAAIMASTQQQGGMSPDGSAAGAGGAGGGGAGGGGGPAQRAGSPSLSGLRSVLHIGQEARARLGLDARGTRGRNARLGLQHNPNATHAAAAPKQSKAASGDDTDPDPDAPRAKVGGTANVVVTPMSAGECREIKAGDALNARRTHVSGRSAGAVAYIYLEAGAYTRTLSQLNLSRF